MWTMQQFTQVGRGMGGTVVHQLKFSGQVEKRREEQKRDQHQCDGECACRFSDCEIRHKLHSPPLRKFLFEMPAPNKCTHTHIHWCNKSGAAMEKTQWSVAAAFGVNMIFLFHQLMLPPPPHSLIELTTFSLCHSQSQVVRSAL